MTEVWPDRSRAFLAGLIGAASNVGMLLVGLLSLVLVSFLSAAHDAMLSAGISQNLVDTLLQNEGWRLLMLGGALSALLTVFIIYFVPESRKWESERAKGNTSHFATRDLWGVLIGGCAATFVIAIWSPVFIQLLQWLTGAVVDERTASAGINFGRWCGTVFGLTIALLGFIYPVSRYLSLAEAARAIEAGDRKKYIGRMLLGACLAGVALLGTWGSLQWAPKWATH